LFFTLRYIFLFLPSQTPTENSNADWDILHLHGPKSTTPEWGLWHFLAWNIGWVFLIQNAWDQKCFRFSWVTEYLHRHSILEGEQSVSMKFIYASFIPYPHSLKVILYHIFNFVHITNFVCFETSEVRYATFHLWHHIHAPSFRLWNLSDFGFLD
jgi:hypothetical protein